MQKRKTNISLRHWLRNSLTLLAEALIWAGCFYVAAQVPGIKPETVPPYIWLKLFGWGFLFLIIVTSFIPNNAYSRTARRDEVVAQAMKTALACGVLAFVVFTERTNLHIAGCLSFFAALTAERLIINSWFIRYSIRHIEHGILICNEESAWQQQALQQNTYGLRLNRLETQTAQMQTAQMLEAYLAAHPEAESVYCAPSALPASELEDIAHICRKQGLVFHVLPLALSSLPQAMRSECRSNINVLSPAKLPLQSFLNRTIKRLTDIVLSLLVLLTIFPVFTLIAFICIKRQSRGPILAARHLCGMNGKTFMCLTFRTRHYEAAPSFLDGINDPGYFPFGKYLTHSKLELLPQFLCVLWGSMTIVGSEVMRPEQYADYCHEQKKLFASGYRLKPGITSYRFPAQAKGNIQADIWYYRNWGFWLDIRIMLHRIGTLIRKSKAKSINYI